MLRALLVSAVLLLAPALALGQEGSEKAESAAQKVPALVEIDILLAEWTVSGDAAKAFASELSGPAAKVGEHIAALQKEGKLAVSRRFRMTAIDGIKSVAQVGEQRPMVTGFSGGGGGGGGFGGRGGGGGMASISYQNVGTIVHVKPYVHAGDIVVLEISIERSDMSPRPNAPTLGDNPAGEKVRAESLTTLRLETSARAKSDETILLGGVAGNGDRQAVFVTVKVTK
jgi:type II secretory pathway component GspD/PulD (secretin)